MTALCPFLHIERHNSGLSCLEEIAQDLQPGRGIQFLSLRGQLPEACCDLSPHALKICPRFINAAFVGTDREIPLLHHIVVAGRVGSQHIIVLLPVFVQLICLRPDQQFLFKLPAVHTAVVDGDLSACPGIQRIEQLRIVQQHRCLIRLAGDGVIDVCETVGTAVGIACLEDAVRPDTPDGNNVLYRMRDAEFFFFLLNTPYQCFYQRSTSTLRFGLRAPASILARITV